MAIARRERPASIVAAAGAILAGSLIMAASAQIAVNLPFSPVPVSAQTLGVALVVGLVGTRAAVLAMVAYLAEGAAGAPVFAAHHGGALWLAAPSAGYLWSFPLAALVTGVLLDAGLARTLAGRFAAVFAGTSVTLALGAAWLSVLLGGLAPAFAAGVGPFVVTDALKAAAAALLIPGLAGAGARLAMRSG